MATAQLSISESDSRYFGHGPGRIQFWVRPGNEGTLWFRDEPTSHPSNLEAWQDDYCRARWLQVDDSGYQYHPNDADTSRTRAYWTRIDHWVNTISISGNMPFWFVNDQLLERELRQPGTLDELTSHAIRYSERDLVTPTIVLDVAEWKPGYGNLKQKISRGMRGQPVGIRITRQNYQSVPPRGWSYVIIDEELIPETYRGQAAAAWVHSRYGQVAVMVSPAQPEFLREMIWLTTGIAGIFYRPLDPPGTANNHTQAIHLRASSTFLNRFEAPMQLALKPLTGSALFSLVDESKSLANVFPSDTTTTVVSLPTWMRGRVIGKSWFNPATDENIVQPLTTATAELTLSPPSRASWVHNILVSSYAADTETTVSAITPLE